MNGQTNNQYAQHPGWNRSTRSAPKAYPERLIDKAFCHEKLVEHASLYTLCGCVIPHPSIAF
jgi:hypothetical protein